MTQIIIFTVCSLVNVILSTMKTILTVRSTKVVASIINAVTYGFYAIVVKQLASLDLTVTVIVTIVTNLIGVYFSINGNTFIGIICLMVSGLCDMFDGTVARIKKDRTEVEKKFGIELDSLSDLVAFGVLPSAIGVGLGLEKTTFAFVLFMYPLCALIRLAYFNVSETERSSKTTESRKEYLGLPVTTSAIILPIVYFLKKFLPNIFM